MNTQLWRRRCRWDDNIKTDLREPRCEGVDWWSLMDHDHSDSKKYREFTGHLSYYQLIKKDSAPWSRFS